MPRHAFGFCLTPVTIFLLCTPNCFAQASAAEELLRLVPRDQVAVCFVVPNLRDNAKRLSETPWLQRLESAPFAQGLLRNNPHWLRIESELKKHLHIDWSELRDDILGDALVLAYRPAASNDPEQGLLLLKTRNPKRLEALVEHINKAQKQSGDLKELTALDYLKETYYQRTEKTKTNFYYMKWGLFAFSGTEAWIQRVIENLPPVKPSAFEQEFHRSAAGKALVSLWLNPRFVEHEFKQKTKGAAESPLMRTMGSVWQALDGIFVTAHADENIELRLTLQWRAKDLPPQAASLLSDGANSSELWSQFPADSIVAVAGRIDVPALATTIQAALPAAAHEGLTEAWRRGLAAAAGLDFKGDVLPNVGPDWGLALWPASNADDYPHLAAAFAVRSGNKSLAVDKALVKGLQFLATLAIFDYNVKHSATLRLDSIMQGEVQVHFVDGKSLPQGIRPAFALKNGYLILASSPDAIARFGKELVPKIAANETPFVRLSVTALATLLDQRREYLVTHVAERNNISKEQANEWVNQARALLDQFRQIQLSHRATDGQATWILRLQPKP